MLTIDVTMQQHAEASCIGQAGSASKSHLPTQLLQRSLNGVQSGVWDAPAMQNLSIDVTDLMSIGSQLRSPWWGCLQQL